MLRRRLATPARLLVCCFAASIALETIHATQPPVDAPQQQPPVAHAAAVERAPSIGSPASNASVGSQQLLAASNPLRLWIDDFFFAKGETALLQEAIAAAGADTAVLAGVTRNRVLQLKSYQLTGKADVLWTGRVGCYEAFKRRLNASHAVSCVPGTQAVSDKGGLAASLRAAYGPAAWGIVPRSFRLPGEYAELAAHIKQEQRSGRNGGLWVLKENAHRGKGVGVVTPPAALARALQRAPSGGVRHVLAQRFVDNQLLIDGRPFYIRLWAVLMGAAPARVYLFDGGVVVFGQQQRAGQSNDALIVNLWTQDRAAAAPWSLGQLETYLAAQSGSGGGSDGGPGGADAVRRLRARLHSSVAATLAAALPNVRRSTSALPGFQGGSFEVLGVDFLVDASLRPWLVEVNFLPSMARKLVGCNASSSAAATGSRSDGGASGASSTGRSPRRGPGSCQQDNPFDVQKEKFMRALLGLLTQRHSQLSPAQQQAQQLLLDMSAAAGEGEAAPCVDAAQLRQVAALRGEQAAAESLGFVPLTEVMYRCLECAAGGQLQLSGESLESEPAEALSGNGACAVLAELAPPPDGTGQQEAQRQCDAPGGAAQQLVARLRRWRERLLLEGASLAPWVLNPRARWRATSRPPAPQSFPMSPADRRVLAWLRRGLPPLDSQQAVRDFCAAAA